MFNTTLLIILGIVLTLGCVIYPSSRRDPREPPVVSSGIPFIGHLVGISRHGIGYLGLQTRKNPTYPIFSLDMLASKIYVVASPSLMYAVQRTNKLINFDPLFTSVAKRLAGIQGNALNMLREVESGGHGLGSKIMHAMIPTLTGKSLDKMNQHMILSLRPFIDELSEADTVDLYRWCQHAITIASTDAKYGHLNPYKKRVTEDAFWSFESNLTLLLANFLPWLTAREAWKGRESAVRAITKYYLLGGHKDASDITLALFKTAQDAGFSIEEIARLEAIVTIALLSNTVPATFWVLFELYSRPKLLSNIRNEIGQNALKIAANGIRIIDLSDLRDNCPLLISTFQEVLRTRTTSAPTRIVMKDVLLAQQYLLRAGSVLNMPAEAIGRNPSVWGSSASEFNEQRYMKSMPSEVNLRGKRKNARPVGGLMTFGVPPNICPGRHLASGEILGLAAMMVLRYDILPVNGVWKEPRRNSLSLVSVMGPLKDPFNVQVRTRKIFEGTSWDFQLKDGKGEFPLIVG